MVCLCVQLRDCDLGAIVNRELKQRVRPIAGVTSHRPVVKADIKHAAKIVQSLDKKTGLWEEPGEKKDKSEKSERRQYGLISRNPVLKNITDYLVDEGSYEEEAYLGAIGGAEETVSPAEQPVERDEENIQVGCGGRMAFLVLEQSIQKFTRGNMLLVI